MLGEIRVVAGRARIIRGFLSDAVKLDLIIATGAVAAHLDVQVLVAKTAAAGNRVRRVGVERRPVVRTARLVVQDFVNRQGTAAIKDDRTQFSRARSPGKT